jgi:hypothetical protein
MKVRQRQTKNGLGGAVEMPGLWKTWKAKSRLPTLSTSPLEISPKSGEIPTFPQLGRSGLEKWKTKSGFPTFPATLRDYDPGFVSQNQNRPLGGLTPAIAAAALRAASNSNCR